MRHARWFSLCGVLLAGCVGVDSNSSDVDLSPNLRPQRGPAFSTATGDTTETEVARPKAKAETPAAAPGPNALAKCLPAGLNLAMTIYPPDGPPFVLEKRLAEIGARCRVDGVLVDEKGKVLSTCDTQGVVRAPVGQEQVSVSARNSEDESRKFFETLLTPVQIAHWRQLGRPMRMLWSFEKNAYDRVMLTPEDFGLTAAPTSMPQPPPNLQRP